jgi:hypothetical protein
VEAGRSAVQFRPWDAADLAMHGMPGLAVALGVTAIGVVSRGQAKIEKRGKGKQ